MGKGSNRRQEDLGKIWDNWDTIFGKKDKKQEDKPQEASPSQPDQKDAK